MTTADYTTVDVTTEAQAGAEILKEATVDPCVLVIFGATGDLTRRKLVPALYDLKADGDLPNNFSVVGFARREKSGDEFASELMETTEDFAVRDLDERTWQQFANDINYVQGSFDDEAAYVRLREELERLDEERGTQGNRVYYLATQPSAFTTVLTHLKQAGLVYDAHDEADGPWSRVIIEKPIGTDLDSAVELNHYISEVLDETQTYRIDHYLGKETVQNILVFRFGNAIFEPLWNRKYIDHIQITMAESIGIEGRGAFFDANGVLRDVVQNHLLQILALIAMEPPTSFTADDIRTAKVQVLRALRPLHPLDVKTDLVRAQYEGYTDEEGVPSDSVTPTFVAMRMMIDNWRWQGVPVYLRAGKGLAARETEVAIQFQSVPHCLFRTENACQRIDSNVLSLRIQPDEGIQLRFSSKVPGENLTVGNVNMDMHYKHAFDARISTAYERLLLDCMRGDATLFARRDEVEEAWKYVMPILDAWDGNTDIPVAKYAFGSQGPAEANLLLARGQHIWRPIR